MSKPESRLISADEIRALEKDGKRTIYGYAAKFDRISEDLGGFREIIRPGAFAKALEKADIRYLVNHNKDLILGRNKSGTLRVWEDQIGLCYEVNVSNSSISDHYYQATERGDISGGSFRFFMDENPNIGQSWSRDANGDVIREITQFAAIDDVTLAVYPAYLDTDSAVRCLESFVSAETKPSPYRRELAKLKIRALEA